MKTELTSFFRKGILVLLILFVALALWMSRQQRIDEARRRLEKTKTELTTVTNHIVVAEREQASLRDELQVSRRTREETFVNVKEIRHELAETFPESRWMTPPEGLPAWVEESPYIWLQKDKIDVLPVQPFQKTGVLRGGVLTVLATDDQQNAAISTELPGLLSEYRALEASRAKYLDKPLAGIENGTIKTVSVEPLSEEGAKLKQRFESKLREIVGDQRANLVLKLGESWLNEQFGQTGEGEIISVVKHPGGDYTLAIKSKNNWFSCGVPSQIQIATMQFADYIPPHIAPMFAGLIPESRTDGEKK